MRSSSGKNSTGRLFGPDDKGIVIVGNAGSYPPEDKAYYPRRLDVPTLLYFVPGKTPSSG
jgi:hypothetical protein